MPDWLTGVLSIFKNEIFSVKYTLIILFWFCGLALLPNSLRIIFETKIKIPYAFEITIFAFSVVISNFFVFIFNFIKNFFKNINISKQENKKRNNIEFIIKTLNRDEKYIVDYLLNSGDHSVIFRKGHLPARILSLLYKGVIYQTERSNLSHECFFRLNSDFESIFKKQIKEFYSNKKV